jgi:hypothetical protein
MSGAAGENFTPLNELEEELLRCWQDSTHLGLFLMRMMSSQVVVLAREVSEDFPERLEALTIAGANGLPLVALFTSSDRATPWAERNRGHRHALATDASWVLRGIRPGVGAAINPGWAVGLEISADGLQRIILDFAR